MIMLHELLFTPLVTKEDVLKATFIRNKHFEIGLVSHKPCKKESSSVDFKNKQKNHPGISGRFQKMKVMLMFCANIQKRYNLR